MGADPLRVAWIDSHRLTRECVMHALVSLQPSLTIEPYETLESCVSTVPHADWGLILYYAHSEVSNLSSDVAALREMFSDAPIVVLSDASEGVQRKAIRDTLGSGANGYICTRTTSALMAVASLRFVEAGGTFAPLDLLLTTEPEPVVVTEPEPSDLLTSRQIAVLAEVKQGKANRVIARDLSMSESAVKVHIRNIMRKMGASNRTQAAFKAHANERDAQATDGDAEEVS
jgi:DNA-binding NarL/FixJ family response regulator